MLSSVQLTTAVNSSVTSDWKNQSGSLSLSDSNDVYRFTLSKASTVNLNLGAIGTGNLVALVKDTNGNNKIEDAEVLFKSSQSADIGSVQLNAGTYYLVVDLTTLPGGSASTLYQVGASLASQSSVLWRDYSNNGQVGLWNFGMTPQGPTMTSTELVFSNVDTSWKVEAVGDFNGDGISDVFWRNKVSNVTTIWILDEQANILTQGTTLTPIDNNWTVIGAGDVDGDGKDDVIWRNGTVNTVVWRMNGNQIIAAEHLTDALGTQVDVPNAWKLEQTADWNGDGKADLFWRNISIDATTNQVSNEIVIWLMDGKKRQSYFSLGAIRPALGFEIEAIGDIDANGTTDVLWRNKTTGQVRLWAMNSQGKVATDQLMTDVMSSNWQTVGMNDVTGDGKGDILWRNNTTGQFLLWEMNGVTIKSRFDIQSADFTLNRSAISMTQQRVNPVQEVKLPQGSVLWRDGGTVGLWNFSSTAQGPQAGSTEQLWQGSVTTDWQIEGTGDMNGDGISDVLWRNTNSNQVIVWELNGQGGLNLVNVPALRLVDSSWKVKGLSDMDGDRRSDVIWQNDISRQLVVWKMDGGQMLEGPLVTNETGGQLLGTAGETLEQVVDWDGDGKGDFFWRNTTTNEVSVWLMNGTQRRGVMTLSNALMSADWKLEGIGDSNGDRRGEVLWRNKTTGEVKLWEMGAGNAVVQKSLGTIAAGWKSLGFADFTLDGKTDIAWRNGQTQEVQIWEMDATGVKAKYTRSGAEYKTSRVAIGALQGKTISVPLSVSMTAASDTGISNSDGITKNRTPEVSGVAMPSATVTLYANNQIVGSTIAASNGQWSIVSQELADGNYELSASIQTVQGSVIQQKIKSITIDTAAPQIASVTGLMDGVAWDASDVFSGSLRDVDNQTQLQYWINNGTKQTIGLTNNASNLDFNNIALSQISNLSTNAEHKLYLKAIDRAGNETQYDYSFMRLDLPEMTEDTDWTGPVGGGEDDRTGTGSGSTGGALPSGAGGYYYIGAGGAWGYSSGSGGGGGDWNPAPFGSGSPGLPTKPGQDPNEQLTYLQALNVILNTAVDALSKHSSVVSKKQVLGEFKSDLLAMGKVIEFYGLHDSFKTQFNELFALGYDKTDNRVSWQEAVMAGWKFAKSVALDSKPVRLKAFESQVFGMVRGMMVKENISLSATQEQELKQTLETFSRRYAVLNPARSQYSWNSYYSGFEEMIWGIGIRGRVSGRWSWNSSGVFSNGPAIENGWLGWDSFKHLKGLLTGLNAQQIINGFENTHILISGATRTATLRRSGGAHVRFGEFLNQLMETGFTLTRVGATNPAGLATSSSAWLEGVLEKNVQLVAGGLGQFFQGLDATSSYWGWSDRPYTNIFADTLDYGQRLMKVAAAVDDPILDAEVLKADVLSELVNLGGAYASLKPEKHGDKGFFLDTLWSAGATSNEVVLKGSNEIENFLKREHTTTSSSYAIKHSTQIVQALNWISVVNIEKKNPILIQNFLKTGQEYRNLSILTETAPESDGFMTGTSKAKNLNEVRKVANSESSFNAFTVDSPETVAQRIPVLSDYTPSETTSLISAIKINQITLDYANPSQKKFLNIEDTINNLKLVQTEYRDYTISKRISNNGPMQNTIQEDEVVVTSGQYRRKAVTRFRKIYYDTPEWNTFLIPGTIEPTIRKTQRENYLKDNLGAKTKLSYGGITKEYTVDMGHVFAALDAVNHPSQSPPILDIRTFAAQTIVVYSNIDNATWIGDLGPLVASLHTESLKSGSELSTEFIQQRFEKELGSGGMLGNIDGLNIARKAGGYEDEKFPSIVKLIEEYYTSTSRLYGPRVRFQDFADTIGLGSLSRDGSNQFLCETAHQFNKGDWFRGENQFSSEENWINYYAKELNKSAQQHIAGQIKDMIGGALFNRIETSKSILRIFLNTIKKEIIRERS